MGKIIFYTIISTLLGMASIFSIVLFINGSKTNINSNALLIIIIYATVCAILSIIFWRKSNILLDNFKKRT
jgi:hypothetical protein